MSKLRRFEEFVDIRLEENEVNCCFDLSINEFLYHDSSTKKIPSVDALDKFVVVVENALIENGIRFLDL